MERDISGKTAPPCDIHTILRLYPYMGRAYLDKKRAGSLQEYVEKGIVWRYKAHAAYFFLKSVCPEYARKMLLEIRKLPEDPKGIIQMFKERGYFLVDLSKETGINRNLLRDPHGITALVLRHLYAYRIVAEKYVALCFEREKLDGCERDNFLSVRKLLF